MMHGPINIIYIYIYIYIYIGLNVKCRAFLSDFNETFLDRFSKNIYILNLIKIRTVFPCRLTADRQADRRTDKHDEANK